MSKEFLYTLLDSMSVSGHEIPLQKKVIAQMKPYYAVFRDSSMANDSVATNFDQIFETYSPDTVRKVL